MQIIGISSCSNMYDVEMPMRIVLHIWRFLGTKYSQHAWEKIFVRVLTQESSLCLPKIDCCHGFHKRQSAILLVAPQLWPPRKRLTHATIFLTHMCIFICFLNYLELQHANGMLNWKFPSFPAQQWFLVGGLDKNWSATTDEQRWGSYEWSILGSLRGTKLNMKMC